jgi:hypothetical protein
VYLNYAWAAYKTTNSIRSFTVLCAIAYILYLVLEEGSPYSNRFRARFTCFKTVLLSFTLIIESRLIYFPEVTKIFQFTSFIIEFI